MGSARTSDQFWNVFLGTLTEGSEAWLGVQGVLASVTGVHGVLAQAVCEGDAPTNFDIGTDDGGAEARDTVDSLDGISLPGDADGGGGGAVSARGADEAEGPMAKHRAREGAGGLPTRWARKQDGGEGAWKRMDWADEQEAEEYRRKAAKPTGGAAGATTQAAPPAAMAAVDSTATDSATRERDELQRKVREAEERRAAEEAAAKEALARSLTPEQRAQAEALHAQQSAAAAAEFGSAQATEAAAQVFIARVQEVLKAAWDRDVSVGRAELLELTPEQLEDWARRHI